MDKEKALKWIQENAPDDVVQAIVGMEAKLQYNCKMAELYYDINNLYHTANRDIFVAEMKKPAKELNGGGLSYLAAPYSHDDPDVRHSRFLTITAFAARLQERGKNIFSPITHCHPMVHEIDDAMDMSWEQWEQYDRLMLSFSSELIVMQLEGWNVSVGVTNEIKIAKEIGIPVLFVPMDQIELWTR